MLHIASLKVPLRRRVLLRAAMEKVVSRTKKSSDGGRIWRTYWLAGTEQKELVPSELISDSAALGETNYTSTCAIKDAERNTITVDVVHPRTTILGGAMEYSSLPDSGDRIHVTQVSNDTPRDSAIHQI